MIRNISENEVLHLSDLIRTKSGIISSMSIVDEAICNMKLFSVSSGESISEEKYNGDMIYFIIEGDMLIEIGKEEKLLHKGDFIRVNANVAHEIRAVTSFKMIQLLVNNKGE